MSRTNFGDGPHSAAGAYDNPALFHGFPETEVAVDPALAAAAYEYGFEGLATKGGPLSTTDILVWLKDHSSGINEELRDRILTADMRSKLIKDLSHLKAGVDKGGSGDLKAEAQKLIEAYEGTPFEAAARQALQYLLEDQNTHLDKAEAEEVNEQIQGVVDGLGKDDQMDMIFIQELTNRLNEQFGFASNFIAKHNDTAMAIIANV